MKDESGGIRINALQALIVIGDKSALPDLRRALNDPKRYVRQLAKNSLEKLGRNF